MALRVTEPLILAQLVVMLSHSPGVNAHRFSTLWKKKRNYFCFSLGPPGASWAAHSYAPGRNTPCCYLWQGCWNSSTVPVSGEKYWWVQPNTNTVCAKARASEHLLYGRLRNVDVDTTLMRMFYPCFDESVLIIFDWKTRTGKKELLDCAVK